MVTLPPTPQRTPEEQNSRNQVYTGNYYREARYNITLTVNTQDKFFKQGIVLRLKFYLLKDIATPN